MGLRILLAIVVLVVLGGLGLLFYTSTLNPPQTTYQQTLPGDRFQANDHLQG
jgi:hypothetical protein